MEFDFYFLIVVSRMKTEEYLEKVVGIIIWKSFFHVDMSLILFLVFRIEASMDEKAMTKINKLLRL